MSSESWNTVQKKTESKTDKSNVTYRLFDFLNEGGCLRCVTGTCRNPPNHGLAFPTEFAMVVKNPIKIDGLSNAITASKLDFNKKTPFYAICNYVNGRCKNCEEGRIKYITYKGNQILLCYPELEKIRNKVTIGIHTNIEVIKKGVKFEASILPLQIDPTNIVVSETDYEFKHSEKDKEIEIYEFVPLSVIEPPVKTCGLDFSKLSKAVETGIINNEDSKRQLEETSMISINKSALLNLKIENEFLKEELKKQQTKIFLLEQNLNRLKYSNHDPVLVEEAIHNLKRLNNRVSADFMNSKYSVFSY
jgi:hypothetical protein